MLNAMTHYIIISFGLSPCQKAASLAGLLVTCSAGVILLYFFVCDVMQGMQSHDRHLFLFDDLLIISKPIKQK